MNASQRAAHRLIVLLLGLSACEQSAPEATIRVGGAAERGAAPVDSGGPATEGAAADDTGIEAQSTAGPRALPLHLLDAPEGLPLVVRGQLSAELAAQLPWCGAAEEGRLLLRGEEGRAALAQLQSQAGLELVRALEGAELEGLDPASCDPAFAELKPGVRSGELGGSRPGAGGARPEAASSADTTPPVGEAVVINSGDATTRTSRISLSIAATDDTAVTRMCISQSPTCTSWITYATTAATSVSGAAGPRTIYVSFRDAAGNTSAPISDTIIYDATAPVDGSLTATAGAGEVAFSWSGFVDPGTGVAEYVLRRATGTTPPGSCTSGAEAYRGAATSTVVSDLTDGTTYAWRLCAIDGAGNVSTGVTTTARPATEYDPPTDGSIILNGGASWTNNSALTVTPSATDPSGVSFICLNESPTICTRWVRMNTRVRTTITRSPGAHTVYAWFRDAMGNTTTTPVSASISYDAAKPTNGTVAIETADATATITATGFADALSGVASYKLMQVRSDRAPSSCSGRAAATSTTGVFNLSGLVNGATYSWRVCAVDAAGNLSSGIAVSGRPAPEYNAPTGGSITINGGDEFTNATRVTVTVSAEDESGLGSVCLSFNDRCTRWLSYAENKSWTMLRGTGTRTVVAYFRDIYGNQTSIPVLDTITLDQTLPVNGTASVETSSGTTLDLSLSGFSDAVSGIASYKVVYSVGLVAPRTCTSGRVGYTGASEAPRVRGLLPDTRYTLRVCAVDGAGNVSSGVTVTGTTASSGDAPAVDEFLINGGDEASFDSLLDLSFVALDADGVEDMCFSDDPAACDDWQPYATTAEWEVEPGFEGELALYAWSRDSIGNESEPVEATIIIDQTAPDDGSIALAQTDDSTVEVSWEGYADYGTGIDHYIVVYTIDDASPASCSSGERAYTGPGTSARIPSLSFGADLQVRVCAVDGAGNISEGVDGQRTVVDGTAPTNGALEIDGGALYTASGTVELSLSADDNSEITEVCVGQALRCTAWQAYEPTLSYELLGGEGEHIVGAWFRDAAGNATTSPVTASIILDQSVPADGTVTVDGFTADTVDLSWADFDDSLSGVASYVVVYQEGLIAPASCEEGEFAWEGAEETVQLTDLVPGERYALRVCAVDAVGNLSAGTTQVVRPLPELDGPVGTIEINEGDEWASALSVSVTGDATDETDVALMCVSADPGDCTDWQAYPGPVTAELASLSGEQTLYAWFEDSWGNQSAAPVSDSIFVDAEAPVEGAFLGAASGDNAADLLWSGFSDDGSGIVAYRVVSAVGVAPASCTEGDLVYEGTDAGTTLTGLLGGHTYGLRLCAEDLAGNVSPGKTLTISTPDTQAPTSPTVVINEDDLYTSSRNVTLSLSASDEGGVTHYCVSNTTTCTTWVAMAETRTWSLLTGTGLRTVYAKFKDAAGNETALVTDTITIETTAPTTSTLTATAEAGLSATFSWTAATDTQSGLAGYKLVYRAGTTYPTSKCTNGTVIYDGPDLSAAQAGLVSAATYSYRLCPYDAAGNFATGTTARVIGTP